MLSDSRNVEVIASILREVSEELNQKLIVVQSSFVVIGVIVYIRIVRIGESDTNWGLHCDKRVCGDKICRL